MKILHTGDLHIGKRVNEFNLLEDQKYIMHQILQIADEIKPNGILIAGDVYDKSMPAAETVELFDEFLTLIAQRSIPRFVISGNHDSPERIAFGARIMAGQHIHMSRVFDGSITPIVLEDENGELNIYMLPFIKPAHVRRFYPDAVVDSYEEAVQTVINNLVIDDSKRNVLIAHQFITSGGTEPERCESESISVGGIDNIDVSIFDRFDYVALGHLHGPQGIGRETVRYAGSPLKYSFSEAKHVKSVTVVDFGHKGEVHIDTIPLVAQRDMRRIKGPIDQLLSPPNYKGTNQDDYLHITLTDEEDIMDAIGRVRTVYPNVMGLDYENKRTKSINFDSAAEDVAQKSPLQLFKEFYVLQNNMEIDDEKTIIVTGLLEKLEGH
jgi:DNA repair protein SbcD/Mre11